MNRNQRKYLREAIEHWEQNLNILLLNYLSGEKLSEDISTSSNDCALCRRYANDFCEGCPIRLYTGKGVCIDTPYKIANKYLEYHKLNYLNNFKEFYNAVEDELKFLYDILKKG